jgi:hypothetical protein
MNNTYWNHNGKYEEFAQELRKLVPISGEVPNKRKNPALERFRKASNCYYDLYNNGLCNRANEFRRVFGIRSSDYRHGNFRYTRFLYEETEVVMDQIIINAAAEQGLIKEVA